AVAEEIVNLREKGQPVLVGTVSIEKSEHLSELLKKKKVPHVVLNAKFHEKEAEIVAQAGKSGSVTIATNMAGRGTDIVLGGNPQAFAEKERANFPDEAQFRRRAEELKTAAGADRETVLTAGGPPVRGPRRARGAPRAQPASRPLRTPGGPGSLALLPLPRGRPDAHLRVRSASEHHAQVRHGGGRPDRAPNGHASGRASPEAGRGAQLRDPQT